VFCKGYLIDINHASIRNSGSTKWFHLSVPELGPVQNTNMYLFTAWMLPLPLGAKTKNWEG